MSNAPTLTPISTSSDLSDKVRLSFLCLFAVSVSLGVAVISLAKILLLCYLPFEIYARRRKGVVSDFSLKTLNTTPVMLVVLLFMALTIAWADIPKAEAFKEWFRHSRMLMLPMVIYLIRNRQDAVWILRCFFFAQMFAMFSSWLLWLGVPVPWATFGGAQTTYGVFASYLEQSVMTVVALNMLFYFRQEILPSPKLKWAYPALLLLGVLNVLLLLPSMTGYIALLISLFVGFWIQFRNKPKVLVGALLILICGVLIGSPKIIARVEKIKQEISQFDKQGFEDSSTGKRLNYWARSWQSFKDAPVLGHGVGTWNKEYNRMGGGVGGHSVNIRSPHSEYFLWMVEGGAIGLLSLLGLMLTLELDRRKLQQNARSALGAVLLVLMASNAYNGMLVGIGTGEYFCLAISLLLCLGLSKPQALNSAVTSPQSTNAAPLP